MTSLDIGRTESSEPSPYGSVPEGFMLLYFATAMLVVLALLLGQRACPGLWEFEAVVTEEHLTVGRPESRDGPDIQVPLSRITRVDLDMTMPRVRRRISGDSVNRMRRGHGRSADGVRRGPFEVVEMGNGWLYTTEGFPPYLVIRTRDTFVIVNYPRADRTRALHQELAGSMAEPRGEGCGSFPSVPHGRRAAARAEDVECCCDRQRRARRCPRGGRDGRAAAHLDTVTRQRQVQRGIERMQTVVTARRAVLPRHLHCAGGRFRVAFVLAPLRALDTAGALDSASAGALDRTGGLPRAALVAMLLQELAHQLLAPPLQFPFEVAHAHLPGFARGEEGSGLAEDGLGRARRRAEESDAGADGSHLLGVERTS